MITKTDEQLQAKLKQLTKLTTINDQEMAERLRNLQQTTLAKLRSGFDLERQHRGSPQEPSTNQSPTES
jgi:hypothetical protein